ncbi:cytochrome P450 89A2-like [Bidens hawaiensis]|uniref:cytochrome P450 89A2-like n=1 Tax=Bidens hawaiensis TaxID=980011 RepID=UPI0040492962
METWFITIVSLCIAALIKSIISRRRSPVNTPPGPSLVHSNLLILLNPAKKFESVLINLKTKYGPIFTLLTGLGPSIFIANHSLAHEVLIKKGAVFSDRPKFLINFNISSASYGPTWRLLRRNLASEVMHPARMKSYSSARKWALDILTDRLLEDKDYEDGVKVVVLFHDVVFRLMVLMCFGDKFDDDKIKEIAKVQHEMLMLVRSGRFTMLISMFPRVGKLMFRNLWKKFEKLRDNKEKVMVPIIKSRVESASSGSDIVAYVDTLVNLRLSKDEDNNNGNGGKLTDREIVGLCSEFLTGGTDSTVSALQWIMANLVKHPGIQSKLYDEILAVVGPPPQKGVDVGSKPVINEEDLQKMRYLKAVVLEGLRRHPPAHFVLPHKVMKEVEVEGYKFPKGAIVNFMVGEMGLDPKVWDEPMEFKPERFLVNDGVFDVHGSKGIKMMPFGAGRRICPGSDLALLHLEYFVANLVWYFDWSVPDGCHVDLSEKSQFGLS